MAFTCFQCFAVEEQILNKDHLHDLAVARDAREDGRVREFMELLERVMMEFKDKPKYTTFVQLYPVGQHDGWPGYLVWLPSIGVSVGPCESCHDEFPCVNV